MNISFTEEQIQELTRAAIEDLKPKMVERATQQVQYQVENQIQVTVKEVIQQVIDEEFKKSLIETLTVLKPEIAQEASKAAIALVQTMTRVMLEQAEKNLKDDYKRGDIFNKLVGKGY